MALDVLCFRDKAMQRSFVFVFDSMLSNSLLSPVVRLFEEAALTAIDQNASPRVQRFKVTGSE